MHDENEEDKIDKPKQAEVKEQDGDPVELPDEEKDSVWAEAKQND